ncbi:MAG: anthranilate synthase component II [Sarcina sp.]
MILIIDNYDSFVYNIYQMVGEFYRDILVVRNDSITTEKLEELDLDGIIISPGPGRPENSNISLEIIEKFSEKIPILGVCLGHQVIGIKNGGSVVRDVEIIHGKKSMILNKGSKLLQDISYRFEAMRYHSLVIKKENFPKTLEVIAELESGTIMGVKVKGKEVYGIQFHPESIGTKEGEKIIENFVRRICCVK